MKISRFWAAIRWLAILGLLGLAACANTAQETGTPSAAVPAATLPATSAQTATSEPAAALSPTVPPTETIEPTVEGVSYQNPIIRKDFPDPFILPVDGKFYAYATNSGGRNIQMAVSENLVDWKILGDALPVLPGWTNGSSTLVWAPEVIHLGDRYVMYYVARDKASGKQCVGAATSSSPEGKFKDDRDAALVCQVNEGGTIDPDPFLDGDKLYLYFKNDGNCCGRTTYLYGQEMTPDGLGFVGEPVRLVKNDKVWEGSVVEAPTMWKHGDGYFLFYSGNAYDREVYAVGYAACETPLGPCQDAPENPILKSYLKKPPVFGPGHQALLQVGDQTWIFYHAWEVTTQGVKTSSRFVWLDKLDWEDGKPIVRGPVTGVQPVPQIQK